MALQVKCKNGHVYIQADIYVDCPPGAPACPECYKVWKWKQGDGSMNWQAVVEAAIEEGRRQGISVTMQHTSDQPDRFLIMLTLEPELPEQPSTIGVHVSDTVVTREKVGD